MSIFNKLSLLQAVMFFSCKLLPISTNAAVLNIREIHKIYRIIHVKMIAFQTRHIAFYSG